MPRLLLMSVFTLIFATPALAQPSAVRAGDDVRITSATITGRFLLDAVTDDIFTLRDSTGATFHVPLSSVTRLAVSRGRRSAGAGALRGAGIGFAVGAVTGIVIGIASGDDQPDILGLNRGEKALLAGTVLGGTAALLGTLVGLAAPGERWERVELPEGARFGRARDGGIVVGYALRL